MKLLLALTLILSASSSNAQLKITVANIKKDTGTILIALYNSKDKFPNTNEAYKEGRVKVKNKQAVFVVEGLASGEYAIALFHDQNDNNKLDKSDLGLPKEPYGFSNDAKGMFGPPPYKKAKFNYNGKALEIVIGL
jgi:uncharacterized protein (DUF2141 family)